MAENSRPPVAIRIVRPYASEDELLEHELETVGKTSVVLIGAHPRPTGVILRFEVTLASGDTVLRGEGRVLAHKENAFRGQSGLTLRFTRLDPKSKSLVDRAAAMREARADVGTPSRPAPPPRPEAIAEALTASTPAPGTAAMSDASALAIARSEQAAAVASALAAARGKANATARTNARRTGRGGSLTPPPVPTFEGALPEPETVAPEPETVAPEPEPVTSIPGMVAEGPRPAAGPASSSSARGPVQAPADRAALLERLRERAGKLPRERVEEILASRLPR